MSDLAPVDTAAAAALWAAYAASFPAAASAAPDYTVERFGDNARLADELLALVLDGSKRATSSSVADMVAAGEPLPRIGVHWVVCDSAGVPRVVLRTTELRLGPFSSVEERFAHEEGEDDRTVAGWQAAHRTFFARTHAARGATWDEATDELLFERFDVVFRAESS